MKHKHNVLHLVYNAGGGSYGLYGLSSALLAVSQWGHITLLIFIDWDFDGFANFYPPNGDRTGFWFVGARNSALVHKTKTQYRVSAYAFCSTR